MSGPAAPAEADRLLVGPVPGPVSCEGYRILQEALTNRLRAVLEARPDIRVAEEAADGAAVIPVVAAEPVQVRLGVGISNTRSRWAKLTADELAQLAELGLHWV